MVKLFILVNGHDRLALKVFWRRLNELWRVGEMFYSSFKVNKIREGQKFRKWPKKVVNPPLKQVSRCFNCESFSVTSCFLVPIFFVLFEHIYKAPSGRVQDIRVIRGLKTPP